MKKLILVLVLALAFTASASADCTKAYQHASEMRDLRNTAISGAALVGAAVGSAVVTAGTSLFLVGYELIDLSALPLLVTKVNGHPLYKNDFDKVIAAYDDIRSNRDSKYIDKVIKKAAKKSGLTLDPALTMKAKMIFEEGYSNDTFCPLIKVRKDGTEKRAVFHRSALIKYIAEKIQ